MKRRSATRSKVAVSARLTDAPHASPPRPAFAQMEKVLKVPGAPDGITKASACSSSTPSAVFAQLVAARAGDTDRSSSAQVFDRPAVQGIHPRTPLPSRQPSPIL
ncbi:MAG: hypothetical protein ACLTYW_09180 [Collinsella sp.]